MPCYRMYDDKRNPVGHICGDLGPHCADCGDTGDNLCDYPVGDGKTCDRSICEYHSHEVAPNMHYCDQHYAEWKASSALAAPIEAPNAQAQAPA